MCLVMNSQHHIRVKLSYQRRWRGQQEFHTSSIHLNVTFRGALLTTVLNQQFTFREEFSLQPGCTGDCRPISPRNSEPGERTLTRRTERKRNKYTAAARERDFCLIICCVMLYPKITLPDKKLET